MPLGRMLRSAAAHHSSMGAPNSMGSYGAVMGSVGCLWGSVWCLWGSVGSYGAVMELCGVSMGLYDRALWGVCGALWCSYEALRGCVGWLRGSVWSDGALWQSCSLGPSRSSSGQRLTETANSLGAVLTSPEGETALEICQMVKAVGQIFSGSRMTTWPRDPWKAQQLPAEISG